MNKYIILAFATAAALFISVGTPQAKAQIDISVGVEPACPYGYYDYAPYGCPPYGYYGPEWFHGRVFIGVGPWFHGSNEFRGHVNNSFDPNHGYNDRVPVYGERARGRGRAPRHFRGNEQRDGRATETETGVNHLAHLNGQSASESPCHTWRFFLM
jgi:hypothetical protein